MEIYAVEHTVYVGPFAKNTIVNNFHTIIQAIIKELKQRKIDCSEASLDIAALFIGKWRKYFIGFFTEFLNIEESINVLLKALKSANVADIKYAKPQVVKISTNLISISSNYVEIESKDIIEDMKILDKKLRFYKKFEKLIDSGIITLIYWLNEYKQKFYLDLEVSLKVDLSCLQPVLSELAIAIDSIKKNEKDGKIHGPLIKPIKKPYDIDLNLIRILRDRFNKLLYRGTPITKEYLEIINEYLSDPHFFTHRLDLKIVERLDEIRELADLDSLKSFLYRITEMSDFDDYVHNAYVMSKAFSKFLPRLFELVKEVKDKKALEYIDEILRMLNNSFLTIRVVKTGIETVNYKPYIYTDEELEEAINEFYNTTTELLKKIPEIIMKIPIEEVFKYLKDKDKFYDYISYPVIEKLIIEQSNLLKYDKFEVVKSIIKLVNNIYVLKFLPSASSIYKKMPSISDLLKTYSKLLEASIVKKLDSSSLRELIRRHEKYLPKDFVEEATDKLYRDIIRNFEELLRKDYFEKAIERLDEEPYNVAEKLIDELIWPRLKRKINSLAEEDLEKAVEYINKLLQYESLRFAFKDTPKGRLKSRLVGKKLALLREIKGK